GRSHGSRHHVVDGHDRTGLFGLTPVWLVPAYCSSQPALAPQDKRIRLSLHPSFRAVRRSGRQAALPGASPSSDREGSATSSAGVTSSTTLLRDNNPRNSSSSPVTANGSGLRNMRLSTSSSPAVAGTDAISSTNAATSR